MLLLSFTHFLQQEILSINVSISILIFEMADL
jgi:hypothetical protein